jgi:hypothetical protein
MTHPLLGDLKSVGFEELERRRSDILKRMQRLRSWNQGTSEMWDQFQMLLDALDLEKEERLLQQDSSKEVSNSVVVNTDPLEDELAELEKRKRGAGKQYTVL